MEDLDLNITVGGKTRTIPLGNGPLTIGRNFTNLLVLDEVQASRFHCVIEPSVDGFFLRDLGSRNGTRLNGRPVKSAIRLKNGDVISIGATQLNILSKVDALADAALGPMDGLEGLEALDAAPPTAPPVTARVASASLPQAAASDAARSNATESGDAEKPMEKWEPYLRRRADMLPYRPFLETDIALVNARGKMVHAARFSGTAKSKSNDEDATAEMVTMLRLLLLICFRSRASDLHVERKTDDALVRARVDGTMVDLIRLTPDQGTRLASLVKILGDVDIAQRNIIQEGHFSARVPDQSLGATRQVDYRLSFAPSLFGQKLVVRILDAGNAPQHLSDLHQPDRIVEAIRKTMMQEAGMILTCGPTGSGKTTTLYAILRDLDTTQQNVVTIEDPVEINLEGVTQIPVNEALGNGYANLLRSVLRQDPDIILIGEIRDAETGRVAAQAAVTGHQVFSTVHARDSVGAIFRLMDLGVEPYLLASSLQTVIAQRLVRALCGNCKVAVPLKPSEGRLLESFGLDTPAQIYRPRGCPLCFNTGFAGRRAVMELLNIRAGGVRDALAGTPSVVEITARLDRDNFSSLGENGYALVVDGTSSFDEVERAVS